MLPYDPTLILRVLLTTITVATGVGLVASGITVGVIVGKGLVSPLASTELVLQSDATIAVNRYLVSGELPLFSDPVDTIERFLASLDGVLKEKFGSQLKAIHLLSFSAVPFIPISGQKRSLTDSSESFHLLNGDTSDHSVRTRRNPSDMKCKPAMSSPTCKNSVSIVEYCCKGVSDNNLDTRNMTTVEICDQGNCRNMTATLSNCSCENDQSNGNDNGNARKCYAVQGSCNESNSTGTVTTAVPSSTVTTTSTTCSPIQNRTTQASIVSANLTLFFSNDKSRTISIEAILEALKQFKPLITLQASCAKTSTQPSTFNASLSKINPPAVTSINLATILAQPSIPPALILSIQTEAAAAEVAFNGNNTATTPLPPTPQSPG